MSERHMNRSAESPNDYVKKKRQNKNGSSTLVPQAFPVELSIYKNY